MSKIKQWLRNWLEVSHKDAPMDMSEYVKRESIRDIVRKDFELLVNVLFNVEGYEDKVEKSEYSWMGGFRRWKENSDIQDMLKKLSKQEAKDLILEIKQEEIETFVNKEEFLDSVVERLNKKQVK